MGDLSEMRGLVVIGGFIAVFVLLWGFIPPEFGGSPPSMNNATTPPTNYAFSDFALGNFNETWYGNGTIPMNRTNGELQSISYEWVYVMLNVGIPDGSGFYKFGRHDIDLWYKPANDTGYSGKWIIWRHNFGSFLNPSNAHQMNWENRAKASRGSILMLSDLNIDYAANSLPYKVYCEHFYMYCDFYFNTTTYANATSAFDHNELYMTLGINFDQLGATFDAWNLISSIMTFQSISGLPFPLGELLSGIMWIGVGYIIFIFALRVVGAVFGGGGA